MNEFDPATESTPTSPAGSPTLGERISDVIVAPVRAMTATAERPMWWAPALLVFVVMFLYTALNAHLLMPAQTEMQLENAPAGQVEMLEEQLELFRDPPIWLRILSGLGAGFGVTILGGLVFALITHMFLKLSEGEGRLGQSVGVVFWAGLIAYGLKPIISWVILLATGSVHAAGLTVASLLPDPDPGSVTYVLASMFGDPFVWWMIGVVAIGMAIAHRMTFGRATTVVVATYLLLSAILVGFTLVGQAVSGA
ncbi:hypothetical protein GF314_05660 [bacterium]|nr:hypothetical protein [bacterium]